MMEAAIKIENFSKIFYNKKAEPENREIHALDGVSFEVKKGEIFGLLGPNGAGKTTAIRCIAGVVKPTTGTAYIFDQNINQFQSHLLRKDLGFLTENHGSYENMTVHENLAFYGGFYGIPNLNQRIETVLQEIGLADRMHLKAGKLSKGQKQRLAIARAILHDPKIVFFDEPTSGLDPVASVKVRDLILNLKNKERTIFLNSHNLEEVQKLCDRVAILDKGKIKRIGTPEDLSKNLWETQETICILNNNVTQEIKKHLQGLDYIKKISVDENEIRIYSEDASAITPKIVKELVQMNAEILEVRRTKHSLEDIYLKLMSEEKTTEEVVQK